MKANLKAVKTFFDPHPGFAGAMIPIPAAVKKVADKLNGKSMPLREAVAKIQAVISWGKVTVEKIENYDGFIMLEITEKSGIRHTFRVISFR